MDISKMVPQKKTEYTQSTYQAVMSKEEGSLGGIFPECIL
jgi:hypothetical protein